MDFSFLALFVGLWVVALSAIAWGGYYYLVLRPRYVTKLFAKQGIYGPSYKLFHGNLKERKRMNEEALEKPMETITHDLVPRILPHHPIWSKQYGEMYVSWNGAEALLSTTDAEMVKELLSKKAIDFPKRNPSHTIIALLGKGLVLAEGEDWAKHRKVLNPAFHIDKLKAMTKSMAACSQSMLDSWEKLAHKEVEVHREIKELTANIISHTAFGSNYAEGKEVFEAQTELIMLAFATFNNINIPGSRFLPTKYNNRVRELEKITKDKLGHIIKSRISKAQETDSFGDDLLGLMLESSRSTDVIHGRQNKTKGIELSFSLEEIIDECKTFFFAGHETTSTLLTWAMFLLSIYPNQWQTKLRQEIKEACGNEKPDIDVVGNLKLVHMFVLETLRLYSPVNVLSRRTTKEMKLGNVLLPANSLVEVPVAALHRKKEYWGEDANEFNPLRFSNGFTRAAKHPNAMMPFSIGPRNCIGQNFAMLEAKIVLSMILQKFSFTLSPNYKHAPGPPLLKPMHGITLILEQIHIQE